MTGDKARGITGAWHNQLGTCMEIKTNEDGFVTGRMHAAVGGVSGEHPLVGYLTAVDETRGVIGLVVVWRPTNSVTTWSGHYDFDNDVIVTNWLLTGGDFDENEWQATRLGHDVFRRLGAKGHGPQEEQAPQHRSG